MEPSGFLGTSQDSEKTRPPPSALCVSSDWSIREEGGWASAPAGKDWKEQWVFLALYLFCDDEIQLHNTASIYFPFWRPKAIKIHHKWLASVVLSFIAIFFITSSKINLSLMFHLISENAFLLLCVLCTL